MRTIPKEERGRVLDKKKLRKVKETLSFKEVTYNKQRLIVCYNPERAVLDAEHRERILEKLKLKIKDGSILSVVDNPNYKKFLKIKGDKPKLDPQAVERDAEYDGMYVLTSNTKLKGLAVVQAYKDLWQVEHAFRQLKSELEMGPLYHRKNDRIRAHVMICFLALILRTIFYKKLRAEQKDASYTEVIADVRAIHAIGLEIKKKPVILRTELKPNAVIAFRALKMNPPKRILQSALPTESKIVVPRLQ